MWGLLYPGVCRLPHPVLVQDTRRKDWGFCPLSSRSRHLLVKFEVYYQCLPAPLMLCCGYCAVGLPICYLSRYKIVGERPNSKRDVPLNIRVSFDQSNPNGNISGQLHFPAVTLCRP